MRTIGTAVAGACSAPNKEISAWLGLVLLMGHLGLWDQGPWESLFLYVPYHWRKEAEGRGLKGSVRPHRNAQVSVFNRRVWPGVAVTSSHQLRLGGCHCLHLSVPHLEVEALPWAF